MLTNVYMYYTEQELQEVIKSSGADVQKAGTELLDVLKKIQDKGIIFDDCLCRVLYSFESNFYQSKNWRKYGNQLKLKLKRLNSRNLKSRHNLNI